MNNHASAAAVPHEERHHAYSQQHQPHYAQPATYPLNGSSRVQASDQSYHDYYPYQQYWDPQYQYAYYPQQGYAIPYQQPHQPQHESLSSSVHPPGVPVPPPVTNHMIASGEGQVLDQPLAYYAQGVVPHQPQQQQQQQPPPLPQQHLYPGLSGVNGMNPVPPEPHWGEQRGSLGAVPGFGGPGSIHPPTRGQSSYRGKSKRGGRGHFGNRGGRASTAQVHAASNCPPPRMAWCELCRVDCNTMEILEQHRSGKKHKKNLQRLEELQNLNQLITGTAHQPLQMPSPQIKPDGATDDGRVECEQQKPEEKPGGEVSKENAGSGGKRMRINDWPRRVAVPPRPKLPFPLVCELCNIRCESQVVFNSHLAGKKHLSTLKRVGCYPSMAHLFRPPNPGLPFNQFNLQAGQIPRAMFGLGIVTTMAPNSGSQIHANLESEAPLTFGIVKGLSGCEATVHGSRKDSSSAVAPLEGSVEGEGASLEEPPRMVNTAGKVLEGSSAVEVKSVECPERSCKSPVVSPSMGRATEGGGDGSMDCPVGPEIENRSRESQA